MGISGSSWIGGVAVWGGGCDWLVSGCWVGWALVVSRLVVGCLVVGIIGEKREGPRKGCRSCGPARAPTASVSFSWFAVLSWHSFSHWYMWDQSSS